MTKTIAKATERIEGKVAQLLNARELVINIGATQGVTSGMKFKVLASAPIEIRDPESGEVLGKIDREKVRVQAVDIQPRYTICKTYRSRNIAGGQMYYLSRALADTGLFDVSPPRTVVETLKAEDSEYLPPLSDEESYVKQGDRVVQLLEDEEN